jgi:hypothetical protein
MAELKNVWTHLSTSLGCTNITWRCVSSHFISVATLNDCCNVIDQTLLCPHDIQLTLLDLALRFLNLFLVHLNITISLLQQVCHRLSIHWKRHYDYHWKGTQ